MECEVFTGAVLVRRMMLAGTKANQGHEEGVRGERED